MLAGKEVTPTSFCLGPALLRLQPSRNYLVSTNFNDITNSAGTLTACFVNLGNLLIARVPGAWARVFWGSLKAPSGATSAVAPTSISSYRLGKVQLLDYNNKKSSNFFFKKSKLSVRGSAKNACDHRNGGKGAGGIRKYI